MWNTFDEAFVWMGVDHERTRTGSRCCRSLFTPVIFWNIHYPFGIFTLSLHLRFNKSEATIDNGTNDNLEKLPWMIQCALQESGHGGRIFALLLFLLSIFSKPRSNLLWQILKKPTMMTYQRFCDRISKGERANATQSCALHRPTRTSKKWGLNDRTANFGEHSSR